MIYIRKAHKDGKEIHSEVVRIPSEEVFENEGLSQLEAIKQWNRLGQLGQIKWRYFLIEK